MREKLKKYQTLSPYEIIQTLHWRNDYRIRKFMLNKKLISIKSHKNFIKNLSYDYIKVDNIGAFNIKNNKNFLEIGLFKNPNKKRVGNILLSLVLKESEKYNKKIILYVYKHNRIAINLYKKFGFKVVDKYKNLLKLEK